MSGPRGLVFRDGAAQVARATLVAELRRDLADVRGAGAAADREARRVRALLSAGALECALADAGDPATARAMAITDAAAGAYLAAAAAGLPRDADVAALDGPGRLRVSRPEGFAYYALVPRDVAAAARGLPDLGPVVTVVGVRTIGATLSAVVAAALAGRDVARMTVRPTGRAYDRTTALPAPAARWVAARAAAGSCFVVVDEGPGLSGSTFLSVAEALVAAGAPAARVTLLGSRGADPASLVAPRAAERWSRFRFVAASPPAAANHEQELSGGAWRALFWPAPAWPAVWPTAERPKRRTRDGRWLLKFEGLGRYGGACHARAVALAEAGVGAAPAAGPDERGFVRTPWVPGRPLTPAEITPEAVTAMGRYCALRPALFPAEPAGGLLEMARQNVALVTGVELPPWFALPCERPAIVDGRMLAHEWIRSERGELLKVDATAHGDDHFYPGPTDVAWDLAGATVELGLDGDARAGLVAAYRASAGEDPTARLPAYEVAYAAFRACLCSMALHGAAEAEALRLRADLARYRASLHRRLDELGLAQGPAAAE